MRVPVGDSGKLLVICLFILNFCARTTGASPKKTEDGSTLFEETLRYTTDGLYATLDWFAGTNMCPFKADTFQSIQTNLNKHIKGQDEGINTILNAISGWEFQRQSGDSAPLVLALTGPTGVGKSETAFRIAEGALAKRTRVGNSAKYLPSGLLQFRGEDYSKGDLEEIHESIRTRLVEHLEHCGGNAVIVFDEVQKVLPGTLEVLMPALERRGSISRTVHVPDGSAFLFPTSSGTGGSSSSSARAAVSNLLGYTASAASYVGKSLTTVTGGGGGGGQSSEGAKEGSTSRKERTKTVTTQHSTENAIFIFISDIGADKMTKLVLSYGNRSAIPQTLLRSEIKSALDEQWSRLRFGKFISEVVPYLPLEPEHIRDILRAKLRAMATDARHSHWAELVVDEDVVTHISGPPLVKYTMYSTKPSAAASSAGAGGAGGGAASSSATAAGRADSAACASVDDSGNTAECPAQTETAAGAVVPAAASQSTGGVTKIFATWGARSLENAGPLQDLRSLLNRYARPWRPDQILHVGLHSESNRQLRNAKWGTQERAGTLTPRSPKQLYIQWCKASDALRACIPAHAHHAAAGTIHHPHAHSQSGPAASSDTSDATVEQSMVCAEGMAHYVVGDETAFSDQCETVQFGLQLN